jgi:hypothetical protein
VTGPGDAELRQRVRGLLQVVEPPVAPVDAIIRRGRGIRLRRAGAAAAGLGLAGIIAAATVLPSPTAPAPAPQPPPLAVTVPVNGTAGPGGVFASGTAGGHAWRLAVQDIADPGYRCIPAITINGTDADPVDPAPGNGADVTLGAAAPGIAFAFVQVPAGIEALVVDGQESIPAIAATECGLHYRLVGFAFRLAHPPRITAVSARPGGPKRRPTPGSASPEWPAVYVLPPITAEPPVTATTPQTDGIWNNVGPTSTETAQSVLVSSRIWSIVLTLEAGGDCYEFDAAGSPGSPQMNTCGPISTPDGPETIMALSLSYPPAKFNGPTGYAVQVSPGTAQLQATVSDGSTQLVTPRVVDGRKYAAFVVGTSLRLTCLTWLDAAGKTFASTTALPRFGYTQFQP